MAGSCAWEFLHTADSADLVKCIVQQIRGKQQSPEVLVSGPESYNTGKTACIPAE